MPSRPFCILSGPTVGVPGVLSEVLRNSSSSGRPCLRPSMIKMLGEGICEQEKRAVSRGSQARKCSRLQAQDEQRQGGGLRGGVVVACCEMTPLRLDNLLFSIWAQTVSAAAQNKTTRLPEVGRWRALVFALLAADVLKRASMC